MTEFVKQDRYEKHTGNHQQRNTYVPLAPNQPLPKQQRSKEEQWMHANGKTEQRELYVVSCLTWFR